jgi:DNA-binding CsgD family transcriptional regulator
MSNEDNIFITKKEVAILLCCSIGTIDNYIKKGYLNTYGFDRRVIFNRAEVIASLIRR